MRLHSIKLSGFKSFVEPTHFQLPGQLVGVVGPERLRQVEHHRRGALGARREQGQRAARRVDAGRDLQRLGPAQARRPRQRRARLRQHRGARRRPVEPLRRDRRQARADARRHEQLPHQQPAGAPARHPGRVPRHRPRPARLRDHRPGHDLADHREQARGAAPLPRGGRRRLEVQGAPPRDRDAPQGHAREPDPRRGHPARAQRQPRQARAAGRGRGPLPGDAAGSADQAAPALVPASIATRRARRSASARRWSRRRPRSSRAPPTCAAPRPSSRRSASRTTRPTTRCTPRRARSARRRSR